MSNTEPTSTPADTHTQQAMFGAGCFWGVQLTFDNKPGVLQTRVGYAGGTADHPTYQQVCADTTSHAEVVHIEFDPAKVTYSQLLDVFWANHNPTTLNRQGPDVGSQYRSSIFVYDNAQREAAAASKAALDASAKWPDPVVTEIVDAAPFWPAEDYHQKYFQKRGITTSCNTGH